MQRRAFLVSGVMLPIGMGFARMALAQPAPTPVSGKQFITLGTPQPTDSGNRIEILEFFWYGCSHCFEFEPIISAWEKRLPKDVVLKRVPVAFRDDYTDQQKLFYTLEALGKLGDVHEKVFQAIHTENQTLKKPEAMAALLAKHGIDEKKFYDSFQSFSVQSKAMQAKALAKAYKIDSVPMMAVDGQFVTSANIAGGKHESVLQVVDFLIERQRKARMLKKG